MLSRFLKPKLIFPYVKPRIFRTIFSEEKHETTASSEEEIDDTIITVSEKKQKSYQYFCYICE